MEERHAGHPWGPPGRRERRPPWWPAEEPWPPRKWRRSPGRHSFVGRAGCLLLLLVAVATVAAGIGLWIAAIALGVVSAPAGALAGALVAFALSAMLIGWMARVLSAMAGQLATLVQAAERVQDGDYSVRLAEPTQRELQTVTRAFNAMTARLEATEDRRRAFLAELAHELRTPIAVIRGQLEALRDGVYPSDPEHIEPALAQASTLERLVEDVRTLGLAETGSLPLDREPVDPAVLVNETVAAFRARAQAVGVALSAELPEDLPTVSIDPARLRSVLGNLVSNALDHTPPGGRITVAVAAEAGALAVAVRDTGTGIAMSLLPHVFDRFVKGQGSTGSGLGLAIARDVISAHGGTITAENADGGGALVRFSLPLSPD
ncbi:MAG TPA: ATP-binding protein [Candidatus Acidoferrales bacterium]|nr:ATP-binding protein [Candidatus Acidoferrales bacterium]